MNQPSIFVLQPFRPKFDSVYARIIQPAASEAGAQVFRADQIAVGGLILEGIFQAIENCSLVIADLTGLNSHVMYELGFAHALLKPVILITEGSEQTPFDVAAVRFLHYNTGIIGTEQSKAQLASAIREALTNPDAFSARPRTDRSLNTVFLSYSHRDSQFLERILVHLKPLERKGVIDAWVDTRLEAGDKWKSEIDAALRRARAAVLLISADFLASDFIVNNELPPLLEQAEKRGTRIIPLVLRPCRFARDDGLRVFQALNDPSRPIGKLPPDEQEAYFDKLSAQLERLFPAEA
jgi:hypothetical protein